MLTGWFCCQWVLGQHYHKKRNLWHIMSVLPMTNYLRVKGFWPQHQPLKKLLHSVRVPSERGGKGHNFFFLSSSYFSLKLFAKKVSQICRENKWDIYFWNPGQSLFSSAVSSSEIQQRFSHLKIIAHLDLRGSPYASAEISHSSLSYGDLISSSMAIGLG